MSKLEELIEAEVAAIPIRCGIIDPVDRQLTTRQIMELIEKHSTENYLYIPMLDDKSFEALHVDCMCGADAHTLRFLIDKEDGQVYASMLLNPDRNVFKRLWSAIKYLFKSCDHFGHFDCTIISPEDAIKIRDLLKLYLQIRKKIEEKNGISSTNPNPSTK